MKNINEIVKAIRAADYELKPTDKVLVSVQDLNTLKDALYEYQETAVQLQDTVSDMQKTNDRLRSQLLSTAMQTYKELDNYKD